MADGINLLKLNLQNRFLDKFTKFIALEKRHPTVNLLLILLLLLYSCMYMYLLLLFICYCYYDDNDDLLLF